MKQTSLYLFTAMSLLAILSLIAYQVRHEIYQAGIDDRVLSNLRSEQNFALKANKLHQSHRTLQKSLNHSEHELLLEQRDQVFMAFSQMFAAMGEGKKPEMIEVRYLLLKQQQLYEQNVVTQEEVITHIDFLLKILPEHKHELIQFKAMVADYMI